MNTLRSSPYGRAFGVGNLTPVAGRLPADLGPDPPEEILRRLGFRLALDIAPTLLVMSKQESFLRHRAPNGPFLSRSELEIIRGGDSYLIPMVVCPSPTDHNLHIFETAAWTWNLVGDRCGLHPFMDWHPLDAVTELEAVLECMRRWPHLREAERV